MRTSGTVSIAEHRSSLANEIAMVISPICRSFVCGTTLVIPALLCVNVSLSYRVSAGVTLGTTTTLAVQLALTLFLLLNIYTLYIYIIEQSHNLVVVEGFVPLNYTPTFFCPYTRVRWWRLLRMYLHRHRFLQVWRLRRLCLPRSQCFLRRRRRRHNPSGV